MERHAEAVEVAAQGKRGWAAHVSGRVLAGEAERLAEGTTSCLRILLAPYGAATLRAASERGASA